MAAEERRPILPPIDEDDSRLVGPLPGSKPKCWVIMLALTFFFIAHGIAIPVDYYYGELYLKRTYGIPDTHIIPSSNVSTELLNFFEEMKPSPFGNVTGLINRDMTTFLMYNKLADCCGILPALFSGPLIDRVGRRLGLIVPSIGLALKAISFYVFTVFELNMYFILVGVLIETLTGGWVVIVLTCQGIIADITPPGAERSLMFTIVEGTQVVTISGSIILTTYWIDNFDLYNPMLVSLTSAVILTVIVSFAIPETLQHTSPLKCSSQLFTRCFKVYKNSDYYPQRKWILRLILVCVILGATVSFTKSNVQQLILRTDFKWSKTKISLYVSLGLIVCWITVLFATKIIQKCLNFKDLAFAILGCISSVASLIVSSFAGSDAMAYIAVAAGAFTFMTPPMIKSFGSKHVLLREQGSLLAGFSACEIGLSSMLGLLVEYSYRETRSLYRGFSYQIMAFIMLIVLIILIILKVGTRSEVRYGYQRLPEDDGPFDRINGIQ